MSSRPDATGLFQRNQIEDVIKKRFFYGPSFEIYGAVSGLYDYGPAGCALQANIIDLWRKHFIINDSMLEVDTTCLTPAEVLKTSGHVDKFADWMCKDPATGEIFRADHLLEEVLESRLKGHAEASGTTHATMIEMDDKKKRKKKVKEISIIRIDDATVLEYEETLARIDGYSGPELGDLISKFNVRNPNTDGILNPPVQFNLMFETQIGPTGQLKAYLRPETAQGQFLNFSKLLEFNNSKMPLASASIGKSFRNEIAPRSGLLRVREFLMAEIEYFVDPSKKEHDRFAEIENLVLRFLPKEVQISGSTTVVEMSIGDAVQKGMVENQTLGYYLARIFLFLAKIGIDPLRTRFRQHMDTEMAHYACDCWDAEIETTYGWIECVGCADRSAYDLSVHSRKTGHALIVREQLKEPIIEMKWILTIDRKSFGTRFKKDAKSLEAALEALPDEDKSFAASHGLITIDGMEIDKSLAWFERKEVRSNTREYTPNVIEPSFGIGRLLYAVLEHSFWTRPESAERSVFSFPTVIAPTKVLLVPLSSNTDLLKLVPTLSAKLRALEISCKVDDSSAAIGRRYARNDELGTPYAITIDFQTIQDGSLTLRERDSTQQIRAGETEVLETLQSLIKNLTKWPQVLAKFGEFQSLES